MEEPESTSATVPKPSVFIGSSTEGLDVAREVEIHLDPHADPTIWKDGVFSPGYGTLESLLNALTEFDFAVVILSPDDLIETRGNHHASPRDNVLFEMGLFMGRLGRDRTFIVHEENPGLKLPSDLAGITITPYRPRANLAAAVSPACTPIIKRIRALGAVEQRVYTRIRKVEAEQGSQRAIVDEHQKYLDLVKYSLSAACYRALWNIGNGIEFIYNDSDPALPGQMSFLYNGGYIQPRLGGFLVFDQSIHGADMAQYFKPTRIGQYLIEMRGDPSLG